MSEGDNFTKENNSPSHLLHDQQQLVSIEVTQPSIGMQSVTAQQTIMPQASPQQLQTQAVAGTAMTQVMTQGPQPAQSPHGVTTSLPPQSAQFYVQGSVGGGMQTPPAIAPAPGPQTTTTTVSALHQPLHHHLAPQPLNHPGVSQSPMPQLQPQVQVIQGGIPGGPYFHQVYQNAQGQLIMPSNLTLQPAPGMNQAQIQPGALNPLNSSIQVIAAGKPFQGQITPHMLAAAGSKGVLQAGSQAAYHPSNIPTSGSQTVLISQLGGSPTLGVISSQPPILPAQSAAPKLGEIQKVNNMPAAAFGQLQQGITWAAPGTLQSPALLTAQSSPIFIRGGQPGQENVFIQNPQAHAMAPNSMINPIAPMSAATQQKARTGMEMQANIQPKGALMRPTILPSVTPAQLRPGASVSTQTAAGQPIAPQLGPRSQTGKMRGKNALTRAPPAIAMQQQQHILQAPQMMQQAVGGLAMGAQVTVGPMQHSVPGGMTVVTMASINATQTTKPITVSANLQAAKSMMALPQGNILAAQPNIIGPAVQNVVLNKMGQMQPPMSATIPIQSQLQPPLPTIIPTTQSVVPSGPVTLPGLPAIHAVAPPTDVQSATCFQQVAPPSQPQVQTVHPQGIIPSAAPIVPPNVDRAESDDKIPNSSSTNTAPSPGPKQQTNNSTPEKNVSESNKSKPVLNGVPPEKAKSNINNGPPKAMVKPQVLTHVIEGFVIQEASEPFPVSRSARANETSKMRPANSTNLATVAPQAPQGKEKTEDMHMSTSPNDLFPCEACGKYVSRSKMKKFKRFCSAVCNKRYLTGNINKRPGSFGESEPKRFKETDDPMEDGKGVCPLPSDAGRNDVHQPSNLDDESMDEGKIPRCDILKWTVQEVVEFIGNLPGCQDYAEDFELQEIDGQALMLLKADHLMSAMSIKLGPALKICDKIEAMRSDKKEI